MLRRSLPCGLLALAALIMPGCGEDEGHRFPVHPTGGKVTLGGKPVAKAIVRFHPTDPATVKIPDGKQGLPVVLTTETDADGAFTLSTYLADDGIPAGDYKVTVAIGLNESDVENGDGAPSSRAPTVANIYRDPASTPLKATVKPGENRFDFPVQ